MAKVDSKVLEGFKAHFDKTPASYVYAVDSPSFIVRLLLGLGILGMLMEKSYFLGFDGDKVHFLKVSRFSPGKVAAEGHFTLKKGEFETIKIYKTGPATFALIKTPEGKQMRMAANSFVKVIENQKMGIADFKSFFEGNRLSS